MASHSTSGHGIARTEDGAVLIEGGIVAERVRVRVERRRGRPYGVLQEVLEPSPWRRTPPCPYASTCGGCDLMHIDDEQQLPLQRRALAELLSRKLPSIELPEIKTPRMPPLRYRQRARLAAVAKSEQVQIG